MTGLSIGARSAAVGIPVTTLRTWEERYGFPAPKRTASGQRVYSLETVARLRRIKEALARGHRAGDVLPANPDALERLLAVASAEARATVSPIGDPDVLVPLILSFDAEALDEALRKEWARVGPLRFLDTILPGLSRTSADGRMASRLGLRHERFALERLIDVLRDLRRRDAPGKHPRRAIVSTLEVKGDLLPLESAATLLVAAGWHAMSLGLGCPIAEIVAAVREWSAAAVVIAMPRPSGEATRRLRRLRERLGRGAILVATGDGAPPAARGLVVAGNLAMLDAWARGRG